MEVRTKPSNQRSFMMTSIPHLAAALQTVLTDVADQAGRDTNFIVREVKLRGSTFTQTLTFGWLSDPDATIEGLAQTAAALGVQISPQGLDQRFSEEAAACLEQVLAAAIEQLVSAEPVAVPLLNRFTAVQIQDSSTITLPKALADVWFGCTEGTAALKAHLGLDLRCGRIDGPVISDGCTHDSQVALPSALPKGSLRLIDLAYFDLERFAALTEEDVFWLSRFKSGTLVWDADGVCWELPDWLASQSAESVDVWVRLGRQGRLRCRLLAVRAPQEVVDQRRRRLYASARKRGRTPSAASLALAAWTLLITNVGAAKLSVREALILARARWQIELLFKLWKGQGRIDTSRSEKAWRVMCEVLAKLLAMLIQHWILLVSCWAYPDRSLTKAAQTVRKLALMLAYAFRDEARLVAGLTTVQECLAIGCRINKRKKQPHAYQLLLSADAEILA
jgi:Transposase DDE domain